MQERELETILPSASPCEYVADDLGESLSTSAADPIRELDMASEVLIRLLEARIEAVCSATTLAPTILLSGGIDSILVAACASRLGIHPTALTVVSSVTGSAPRTDDERAGVAAANLGLAHSFLRLEPESVQALGVECIRRLELAEMWEVTSAIPVLAALRALDEAGLPGPALSGSGADALFLGGKRLIADPSSDEGLQEFRDEVLTNVQRNFTRHRLIPDYYERLLETDASRYVQIFQTHSFFHFAQAIHPELLWRSGPDGKLYDKYLLRYSAWRLGVAEHLVFTQKSPLQLSSGTVDALLFCARRMLAAHESNNVYADPLVEPSEHTAVRLFLDWLGRQHG